MATWRERGILTDVTDGVAKLEHSYCTHAPLLNSGQTDEECVVYVIEDLIESYVVYEPVKELPLP